MRLLLYSTCLMLLFVLLGTSTKIHFNVNIFVDMILGIRKLYSAASVIFVHPGEKYEDNWDLQIEHLIHTSSRMLSRRNIMTTDVHFKTLWKLLKYYRQIVRPITIVIIPSFEAYLEFTKVTKAYPMSFPVWFTMFLYDSDNNTHDYCRKPIGNPFNVAFDTQMLVLCRNDSILREWYSVKGDTVKTFDLAEWERDEGFVPLTNLPLYDRRKDMEGIVLRAVTIKDLSISTKFEAGNYLGSMYEKVMEELTSSLNFTLEIVAEMNEHGQWNHEAQVWSGVMAEIAYGHADIAIADMSMTSLRVRDVDFTLPLIISRDCLYIREPGLCGVKWLGYFQTFNSGTWAMIVTLIAIAPLLVSFMKTYRESRGSMEMISENFICIWGIFCQQALIEFPKITSLRVAYFTIFLTAVLIMAHYSAALVCFLTACTRVLPFQTIDEFVNDGTYKLIIPFGTADYDVVSSQAKYKPSTKSFSVKLMKIMKEESELPRELMDGFVQICNERKVAYLILNALKRSVETEIPCKLSSITTERIDNLGMILSKDNPYTDVINYHLQKFSSNGMLTRLRNARFLSKADESKIYEPVRLVSVIPILAFLGGGFIISIVILIIEKIYYKRRRKFQPRVFHPSRKLF